jgi:hypothetical protein
MTSTFKSMLICSATVAALAAPALAQVKDNTINNSQQNWAQTRAVLNARIQTVTEDVALTSAAIGNTMAAELGGSTNLNTNQTNTRNVTADLNIHAIDALGSLTATAAAIGNSAAVKIDEPADTSPIGSGSNINNNQLNSSNVVATLNLGGGNITGNDGLGIAATAAAVGNSLGVDVKGDLNANNLQRFFGDARSNLNVNMHDVTGDSKLTSAAIANTATFDVTDASRVHINNTQYVNVDPTAVSNIKLGDIDGDVTSTTAAISNSLSVTTLPASAILNVNSSQINNAETNAFANLELGHVQGSVAATAAAIGNSVSISNLPKF